MTASTVILAYLSMGGVIYFVMTMKNRDQPSIDQQLLKAESPKQYIAIQIISQALVFISCLIIWPYTVFLYSKKLFKSKAVQPQAQLDDSQSLAIDVSSLIEKVCVDTVEAEELVDDPLGCAPRKPFGFRFEEWYRFKQKIDPSGELWTFSQETPGFHKSYTVQISGYCVKSLGSVHSVFVTQKKVSGLVRT